ncbi:MAG: hypothetical protein Athens041674_616 [Parcubacteria group bacterium Athens0416_74]|nr:MAG: hypothetical protein Athens041674_616 [Parcubacteria group bacterium Athens0416_74]
MKKGTDYEWEGTVTLPTEHFDCGHCGSDISADIGYRGWYRVQNGPNYQNILTCIYICHACSKPNYFDRNSSQSPVRHLVTENFPEHVKQLSPEFIQTYNQSLSAEKLEFDKIAGPGYRRALEFLVKDFAISQDPSNAEAIKSKQLGPCISEHITHDKITSTARGATYIGNDETHYVRKWVNKDIQDLKKFISLVVYWIEAELATEDMQKELGV